MIPSRRQERGVSAVVALVLFGLIAISVALVVGFSVHYLVSLVDGGTQQVLAAIGLWALFVVCVRTVVALRGSTPETLSEMEQRAFENVTGGDEFVVVADAHSDVYRVESQSTTESGWSFEVDAVTDDAPMSRLLFDTDQGQAVLVDPNGRVENKSVDSIAVRA